MKTAALSALVLAVVLSSPLGGQPSRPAAASARQVKSYIPPKTPWGDPDLQGV
jgi:hypothetical protein